MKKVHFIGIGGTGISAIALVLLERGMPVSGTDMVESRYYKAVTQKGAFTMLGHHPELATQADVVVRSSAIPDSDPEVRAALQAGIPVLKRAEFLAELTAGKQTLAIAGSHGKTTSTALLVTVLRALGKDPSFILGAEIKDLHTNAHAGSDDLFVIEADEYDYMFLGLEPQVSVITNIEHDHPDFFPTPADYSKAFTSFLRRTVPGGCAIVCDESEGVRELLEGNDFGDLVIYRYGFSNDCDYRLNAWRSEGSGYAFELHYNALATGSVSLGEFSVELPGRHNALNAAAALAAAHQFAPNLAEAATALANCSGSERRFETIYNESGVTVINDYGHHPSQLDRTLEAARELYPDRTLWAVWEPHTFSRTFSMSDAFATALNRADQVVILKIYAAREADEGFTPQAIADSLPGEKGRYYEGFDSARDYIAEKVDGNDVIVVFSAGLGPKFSESLVRVLRGERDMPEVTA